MKYHCCHKKLIPFPYYTEVAIIGNGPSSLFLSYILNGNAPYYSGSNCDLDHVECACVSQDKIIPETTLHHKLTKEQDKSLLELDYEHEKLSEFNLEDSVNPLSLLLDKLSRYEKTPGIEGKSYMYWHKKPLAIVPHIAIGKGKIGGGWQNFSKTDGKALSIYRYLELPGYTFSSYCKDNNIMLEDSYWRPHRKQVYEYLKQYAHKLELNNNMYEDSSVTKVYLTKEAFGLGFCACRTNQEDKGYSCEKCSKYKFLIKGYQTCKCSTIPKRFAICSNYLVLATGTNETPKQVEKIETVSETYYDIKSMISSSTNIDSTPQLQPVLVIGTGLSAADAILQLRKSNIPVIHIYYSTSLYKKKFKKTKHPLSSYHRGIYPEYYEMFQKMKRKECDQSYEAFPDSCIESAKETSNGLVVEIRDDKNALYCRRIRCIGIFIGKYSNLDFLKESLSDLALGKSIHKGHLPINKFTYQVQSNKNISGVYAIGSLGGDTLIRYVLGGGLGAAASIINGRREYKCL